MLEVVTNFLTESSLSRQIASYRRIAQELQDKYGLPVPAPRLSDDELRTKIIRDWKSLNERVDRRIALSQGMKKKNALIERSRDLPATCGMLDDVRSELKSGITSLELKMNAGFKQVESKMSQLQASVESLHGIVHRMSFLTDEQRFENRYVMEQLTSSYSQQDRIEERVSNLERTIENFKR